MITLVWFRHDLRVTDNPALSEACASGPVVACFVISHVQWRAHGVGDRRLAFLGRSVNALASELAKLGIALEIIHAPTFAEVPGKLLELALKVGARCLAVNAEYPLNEQRRDAAVTRTMAVAGIDVLTHHGGVAVPPGTVLTQKGEPYSVYGAFKRRWLERVQLDHLRPVPALRPQGEPAVAVQLTSVGHVPVSLSAEAWPAGERVAQLGLRRFVGEISDRYSVDRDIPALAGTSNLSHHLSVGALASNQCLYAAGQHNGGSLRGGQADTWIDEIIWRDFYRHVIALFPDVSRGRAFRPLYEAIPWRDAPEDLAAWQAGNTGYPLVDAGMRQLVQTGWMHNRLRMVTAMFLSKHLLIDWRKGEHFFMRELVDGDFAANNGGWQWSASTGTDAAPYFRVFNPTTQGKRFDPTGEFVRTFLPELDSVPDRLIFEPHSAGLAIDYPAPIVEHSVGRARAIEVFKAISAR